MFGVPRLDAADLGVDVGVNLSQRLMAERVILHSVERCHALEEVPVATHRRVGEEHGDREMVPVDVVGGRLLLIPSIVNSDEEHGVLGMNLVVDRDAIVQGAWSLLRHGC